MRRLKVISNLSGPGGVRRDNSKVVDAETGEMIQGVQSVDIHIGVDDHPTVTITFIGVDVDIETDNYEIVKKELPEA